MSIKCTVNGSILLLLLFNVMQLLNAEGKQTAYACEGNNLEIDCKPGKVIHLIRAIYGRFSLTICNDEGVTEWSVNCGNPRSILILNGTCNYQRSCSVKATSETFGDLCNGTKKYLEAQYECLPESSITSTTPKSSISGRNSKGNMPSWHLNEMDSKSSSGDDLNLGSSSINESSDREGIYENKEVMSERLVPNNRDVSNGDSVGRKSYHYPTKAIYSTSNDTETEHSTVFGSPSSTLFKSPELSYSSPGGGKGFGVFVTTPGSSYSGVTSSPSTVSSLPRSSSKNTVLYHENDPFLAANNNPFNEKQKSSTNFMDSINKDRERGGHHSHHHGGTEGDRNHHGTTSSWPHHSGSAGGRGSHGDGTDSQLDILSKPNHHDYNDYGGGRQESSDFYDSNRRHHHVIATTDRSDSQNNFYDSNKKYINKRTSYCTPKLERGLYWNWTAVNETMKQPCPGGASGIARWYCSIDFSYKPRWAKETPDLGDCKSAWLLSLQTRVLEGDIISNVANDLAQVTGTKQMYGGDIKAAVGIIKTIATRVNDQIRTIADPGNREIFAGELLQLILEAGSNLLARLEPWKDLTFSDQMKFATDLLVGLEDNAFNLANVVTSDKIVRKSVSNILTTIYAIEANNVHEISFPSDTYLEWSSGSDSLIMPAEALRENSDGGLVRLVCFAYKNLERVLQPLRWISSEDDGDGEVSGGGGGRKVVNSHVISASLNQGRHIQLALPVQLTLSHLWLDNMSNPQCVFWDYTQDKWSDEGCRVVETNRTHTMCQCTHLTNFAILMDVESPPEKIPTLQIIQVVMYVCSAVFILCLLLTLIITQFCIHGKVFQTMILKNLFSCMLIGELIFVLGIHQTENSMLCSAITFCLHYFALASILWLFLHGFHLHLIVIEAAESGLSRQLWYYGVSYGSPAIVVLLSFILDPRSYRSDKYCWMQTFFTLLCFVGPAVLVAMATLAVLVYTSYKVCGLLSAMPKKQNDEESLYFYTWTWLRGSFLILVLMSLSWTLRLFDLEYNVLPVSYSASISLLIEGIAILAFHVFKAEHITSRICDCGKSSDSSDTEMSTHSQQHLQNASVAANSSLGSGNGIENPQQRAIDGSRLLSLSRQAQLDMRNHHDGIYSKQLAAAGVQPSPEFYVDVGTGAVTSAHRYPGNSGAVIGVYSKGSSHLDGNWTRGSSYSDIRSVGFHRTDPVYEEIEKPSQPRSPRVSSSDLSEDESHLYPHDLDLYHRIKFGQQQGRGTPSHHHSMGQNKGRKPDFLLGAGEAANPLLCSLSRNQIHHQQSPLQNNQPLYGSRHRAPPDHHHHVSLKGLHSDEQILQNIHMV